jgi:hypothetical protein
MKLIHAIRRISSSAVPVVARLLKLWVRIPPGDGCSLVVSVVCFEVELCDTLISRAEESYRLCCVVAGDLETSRMRRE